MDHHPLFRPLLERGRAVYFVFDLTKQRVVYVSEAAFEQLTGDPAAHINEDWPHWLQRLHPDDREHLAQVVAQAEPGQVQEGIELRLPRANGTVQWLSLTLCVQHETGGQTYLVGSALDITQQKESMANLQRFGTKKNAVLEILSHDLAGPMVLLQQLSERLQDEIQRQGPLAAPVQHLLQLMQRTCQQSVSLIHDFVDAEFLESANIELNLERTDLVVWVQTLMEEYQRSEILNHLQFVVEAPPHPVYVRIDVDKFHQVLNNLVSNSIKFTPEGGRVTVRVEVQAEQILVVVSDTGIGIPKPMHPLLFDKFTKARRPGLRGEKTTGLGMSVIRTIVELHQGRIDFTSSEDKGSTFVISLPNPGI